MITLCRRPHHMWQNVRDERQGKSEVWRSRCGGALLPNAREKRIVNQHNVAQDNTFVQERSQALGYRGHEPMTLGVAARLLVGCS